MHDGRWGIKDERRLNRWQRVAAALKGKPETGILPAGMILNGDG
jgi:hypothetical protein